MQICPKCSYERKPTDHNPDWQCPACGVAYCKVASGASQEKHGQPSSDAPAQKQTVQQTEGFHAAGQGSRAYALTVVCICLLGVIVVGLVKRAHRPAPPGIDITSGIQLNEPVIVTFPVHGETVRELDESMLQNGPIDPVSGKRGSRQTIA